MAASNYIAQKTQIHKKARFIPSIRVVFRFSIVDGDFRSWRYLYNFFSRLWKHNGKASFSHVFFSTPTNVFRKNVPGPKVEEKNSEREIDEWRYSSYSVRSKVAKIKPRIRWEKHETRIGRQDMKVHTFLFRNVLASDHITICWTPEYDSFSNSLCWICSMSVILKDGRMSRLLWRNHAET